MTNRYKTFVAIDFGSNKIKGAVAEKADDSDEIVIIANAEVLSEGCIRYGVVYNREQAAKKVQELIKKLETLSHKKIRRVYVALGGQSLHTVKYIASDTFNPAREVLPDDVQRLKDMAIDLPHEGYELLKVYEPEYFINGQATLNPVGINATTLNATYKSIYGRPSLKEGVENVLKTRSNYEIVDTFIAPTILADTFLNEDNKKLGCALIDVGGACTTICVYKKGLLAGVRVIPIGGDSITRDLTALHITAGEAERIKCQFGTCRVEFGDRGVVDVNTHDRLSTKTLAKTDINRYIEARAQEIADNIKHHLFKLISKENFGSIVFLTGGGSLLNGFQDLLLRTLGLPIEASVSFGSMDSRNKVYIDKPGLNLLYSILRHAEEDCSDRAELEAQQKNIPLSIIPKEEVIFTENEEKKEPALNPTEAIKTEDTTSTPLHEQELDEDKQDNTPQKRPKKSIMDWLKHKVSDLLPTAEEEDGDDDFDL